MRYGWTLDKREWDSLIASSEGVEWKRTELKKLYRGKVPNTPGAYVICTKPQIDKKPFSDTYNIIYAGFEGVSLKRRFVEHCNNNNEDLKKAKSCFGYNLDYWFTSLPLNKAETVETFIIDCFGPPVNKQRGKITARILDPIPA